MNPIKLGFNELRFSRPWLWLLRLWLWLLRLWLWLLRPWLWFSAPIVRENLHPNPYIEFARWYRLAMRCFWLEFPDAVCLATLDGSNAPDSRMVLLKEFDTRGFVFFTNYNSRKGQQLNKSHQASMTFFWDALQRQVRLHGYVEACSPKDSDRYFRQRSRDSQIGAWASKQSEVLLHPADLDRSFVEVSNKFEGMEVPRPPHWGGYRLVPHRMEFWKARPNRLHDRFVYSRLPEGTWKIDRLYP